MFGYESLSAAAFADDAVDSTVGITAVTGTGSVGTAGVSTQVGVTGVTATSSVGSVSFVYTQPISAVTATGSVGTIGVSHTQEVTSVTGTGSVGTVVASDVEADTGTTATGSVGNTGVLLSISLGASSIAVEDSGAFGGAPFASTVISGNVTTATYQAGLNAYVSAGNATALIEVAVSSVLATGSVGAITTSQGLNGVTATGSAGNVVNLISVGLTGTSATGSVGSVTTSNVFAITGNTATSSVGSVVSSVAPAITSVTASGSVGTVIGGQIVSGVTSTGAAGTVGVGDRSIAITGNTATGTAGTVKTWENVVTDETANWVDVFNGDVYEDSGTFSGGAVAATTIAGNIITLSRPNLSVVWGVVNAAETSTWTNVLNTVTYEDCGAFSGGAIAATTIAGNVITLSRPDLPVTWSNVDTTETTTWYPIAA